MKDTLSIILNACIIVDSEADEEKIGKLKRLVEERCPAVLTYVTYCKTSVTYQYWIHACISPLKHIDILDKDFSVVSARVY